MVIQWFYIPDFHRFSGCQTFALLSYIRGIAPRRHAKPSGSWDGQAVEPVWIPGNKTGHPEHEIRLLQSTCIVDRRGYFPENNHSLKNATSTLEAQITINTKQGP